MSKKPANEEAVKFGIAIQKFRIEKRLNQEEFADHVGNDRSYHGEIERGEVCVSFWKVCQMAKKLGLSASEFIKKLEKYGF
jgi:transcriptional regulator with XRE-family HTH domain